MRVSKDSVLKRLRYIEGHLRGIHGMVEKDVYCVEIIKQTYAVRRAIQKLEQILMRDHIAHCVPEGIHSGRDQAVLNELEELFALSRH